MSSPHFPYTCDKDKLFTAVSCHVHDYTLLRGMALHAAGQKNTETETLIREKFRSSIGTTIPGLGITRS